MHKQLRKTLAALLALALLVSVLAIEIARESGIDLEHLTSLLTLLYEEE